MKMLMSLLASSLLVITSGAQNLSNIYVYKDTNTNGYFFTVDPDVLKKGQGSYQQQKFTGIVHTADDKGTSPVWAFYNPGRGGHFYTINEDEIQNGWWGYMLQGVAFYAYKKKVPGTVPLHRYFHQEKLTHYYSTQFAKNINGWNYEGIAFHIFPNEKTAKASAKLQDAVTFLPPLVTRPRLGEQVVPDEELLESVRIDMEDTLIETPITTDTLYSVDMDETDTLVTIETTILPDGLESMKINGPLLSKGLSQFISLQDQKRITEYKAEWKTEKGKKFVVVSANNKKVMTIALPENGDDLPTPGVYRTVEWAQELYPAPNVMKLQIESGFGSQKGGVIVVEHNNEAVWFIIVNGDYISMIDPKTQETKRLAFAIAVPIK